MRRSGFLAVTAAVVCAAALTAQQAPPQTPPDQPTFRTRVTMVPIDVRVLDSSGNPITDLTAHDFTILENGQRQTIRHFSTVALTAETREAATTPSFEQLLGTPADALAPQQRRVFLIILGRGRVVGQVKEVEALVDFVRARLLPQDLVAVQAYNRSTPFTGNHEAVAQWLEHFHEQNAQIESDLEEWFSGLRALYGRQDIPPQIQSRIDSLFVSVPALAARDTMATPLGEQVDQDLRVTRDDLQRAAVVDSRPLKIDGIQVSLPDTLAAATADRLGMTLDEYAAQEADLRQDATSLFAGINYLRHVEGEKHLVFVTPRGLSLPRVEQNQSLAAAAADGRVAISAIYTGAPAQASPPLTMGPERPFGLTQAPVAFSSQVFQQTARIADLREITAVTGGQLAVYQYGSQAVDRIDRATRFHYLLAYDSSNPTLDGRFRDVRVQVNRRGATVHHRRGYFASQQLIPMNRREFITATRIAAAGAHGQDIRAILVDIKKTAVEGRGDARQLVVELQVRAPKMQFAEEDGRRVGTIDLALFVADGRQRGVGDLRQTIDLRLRPESVERFLAEGTTFTTRVPITGTAFYLKVIAYDYGSDLVGSATRKLR